MEELRDKWDRLRLSKEYTTIKVDGGILAEVL